MLRHGVRLMSPFDLHERGVPRSTMSITASGAPLRLSPSAPRVRSLSSVPWVDIRRAGSFLPNQSLRSLPSPFWGMHRAEGVILHVHGSVGSRHSTCTFSLITDVFPKPGYVDALADMTYGRRPTVSEPPVPLVRNRERAAVEMAGLSSRRGWLHSRRRRQGSWWAPRSSKPMWGRELPGGFDSRPPPPRSAHTPRVRSDPRCLGTVEA